MGHEYKPSTSNEVNELRIPSRRRLDNWVFTHSMVEELNSGLLTAAIPVGNISETWDQ